MTMEDPYRSDDNHIRIKSYVEFKLSKVDSDNLNAIEKSLNEGKLTAQNGKDSLDYLSVLYKKIFEVKKQEYQYEGDDNENVNEYLERISLLRNKILSLK